MVTSLKVVGLSPFTRCTSLSQWAITKSWLAGEASPASESVYLLLCQLYRHLPGSCVYTVGCAQTTIGKNIRTLRMAELLGSSMEARPRSVMPSSKSLHITLAIPRRYSILGFQISAYICKSATRGEKGWSKQKVSFSKWNQTSIQEGSEAIPCACRESTKDTWTCFGAVCSRHAHAAPAP